MGCGWVPFPEYELLHCKYSSLPDMAMDAKTDLSLFDLLQAQKDSWKPSGPSYKERRDQLKALDNGFRQQHKAFIEAVSADFGHRAGQETLLGDLFIVHEEIKHILRHLRVWMRSRPAHTDWKFLPARAWVQHQPVGVVGIISPWNYPINLALAPLAAALAAGNHVMIKPSELTPRTSELLKTFLADIFPATQVSVVTGGADVAASFSSLPFDHLMFTGSTNIGRKVMAAAAENLTPVTLELGGKSPAIVDNDFSLSAAAERLITGKLLNAGQTCIAPDYVLLTGARSADFVKETQKAFDAAYPDFGNNKDYTSLNNDRHYQSMVRMLEDAKQKGAEVIPLAAVENDPETRRFTPCLVLNAPQDSLVMQDEIFGPILPVMEVKDVPEAVRYINRTPRPLSLYYFGYRHSDYVLNNTIAGGVCLNDTLLHMAQNDLPFGGIGASGMGQYHGYDGFLTFTKQKAVMRQSRLNSSGMFRPPYASWKERLLSFLSR